jgi:hypothetical protein
MENRFLEKEFVQELEDYKQQVEARFCKMKVPKPFGIIFQEKRICIK